MLFLLQKHWNVKYFYLYTFTNIELPLLHVSFLFWILLSTLSRNSFRIGAHYLNKRTQCSQYYTLMSQPDRRFFFCISSDISYKSRYSLIMMRCVFKEDDKLCDKLFEVQKILTSFSNMKNFWYLVSQISIWEIEKLCS